MIYDLKDIVFKFGRFQIWR